MNITIFTGAKRDKASGCFGFPYFATLYQYQTMDAQFSLLKFSKPDDDLSLDCLAANLTSTLKYISVFPVKCSSKIAKFFMCVYQIGVEVSMSLTVNGKVI